MSVTESERTSGRAVTSESDPRFQIAAARRILHREGLDSQVGGHVSLRVPGEEAFLVTPFQYFDETLPEHVSKVGFDLRVIEPGTLPASPGINFHASIYAARPDVHCVIHTHAKNMSVLSTTGVAFDVYYDYAAMAVGGKPLDRATAESYREAYIKNDFREQMWLANYRRLLRSDPDLFATLR
jgi:L-fuculose-phosphate aldolase